MKEKPYLYPSPRVLVEPGKTVPLSSLSEEEQQLYEQQILLVSACPQICEDDEDFIESWPDDRPLYLLPE